MRGLLAALMLLTAGLGVALVPDEVAAQQESESVAIKPFWPETFTQWAESALPLILLGSAWIAIRQLRLIRATNEHASRSHQHALETAKATFLLELDGRWEGAEMQKGRDAIKKLLDDTKVAIAEQHIRAGDAEKAAHLRDHFRKKFREMRENGGDDYHELFRLCGFFETAGLMVKRGYIAEEDIIGLFKGPLFEIGSCFREHIADRQGETGVPKGFFEHTLWLCERAERNP